jgi:hypothetical protein
MMGLNSLTCLIEDSVNILPLQGCCQKSMPPVGFSYALIADSGPDAAC